MIKRARIVAAVVSVMAAFTFYKDRSKNDVLSRELVAELWTNCILIVVLSYFARCYIRFSVSQIMIVRVVHTFFMLHQINLESEGYKDADPKELALSIYFIGLPALIIYTVCWKFQFLLAIPLMGLG